MYDSVDDIIEALKLKNGVMTARLQDVVRAFPLYSNCTKPQVDNMVGKIQYANIGCYPSRIECKPDSYVGLYLLESHVEKLVEAILQLNSANDEIVRSSSILL